MKTVSTIKELITKSFNDGSNSQAKFIIGKIKPEFALMIKQKINLDVEGYKHIIDNYAIIHTLLKHGNAEKEAKQGQVAVTLDYFEKNPRCA